MSKQGEIEAKGDAFGHGITSKQIFWIGVAFSSFQLFTAAYSPLSTQVLRSVHVGFLLLMVFAINAAMHRHSLLRNLSDWLLGILAFSLSFYHWIFEGDLIQRSGDPSLADLAFGICMLVLVFEGARRMMGLALPLICLAFATYALLGQYFPAPFNHRGYGLDQVVNQYMLGTEGVFGTPAYVSSTYIFLFILFGSFLEQAGMIRLFTDIALGTVGHTKGGPAKVSVISSCLMGTINGSGVANVVTTGQFTIPLMKKFGYRAEFAGAVEATSSMGGQIMPPVMGAVAFIMAETLDIPYIEVVKAAVIPAVLYYVTAFWMVHLEAGRAKLLGLAKEDCPSALAALRRDWFLILPLAVLVFLLLSGYTPMYSGTVGLAMTALLILGVPLARHFGSRVFQFAFWIALGLGASAFFEYGINVMAGLLAALISGNFLLKGGRETLSLCLNALAEGARSAVPVGVACALVGVIIGTMTLTGAAGAFTQGVVALSGDSLFMTLVLTMVACLILGMGIPTIPNYIITSSLVAPTLLKMGVPLIVSHMFVFYFGIMADLTPPVALAAFAAATIAKSSFMKTGLWAVRIAIAGFVIPYMAVYDNSLMLQGDWTWIGASYIVAKALIAIFLWGAASIGFLFLPLNLAERVWATGAAFLLVAAIPITDELGFAASALFVGYHAWKSRRMQVAA